MAVALSLVFFTDKPLTAQEALILKNVEAIAQSEEDTVIQGRTCEQRIRTYENGMTMCVSPEGHYKWAYTERETIYECTWLGGIPADWCLKQRFIEYIDCSTGMITSKTEFYSESINC